MALVNEAYLRLIEVQHLHWQNRAHFLAMAARLMRRVLVDSARAKGYQKRGGGAVKVTFDEGALPAAHTPTDLVALDDALTALGRRSGPARTPAFVASRLHTAIRTGRASQRAVIEATRVH